MSGWASLVLCRNVPLNAITLKRSIQGRPSPGDNEAFPPISEIFRQSRKISQVTLFRVTFSPKMSFHPQKFLMKLFSHRLKVSHFDIKVKTFHFSPFFFPKHVNFFLK